MRGYAAVGLDNPKMEQNVGGSLRAAHVYGAKLVVVSGSRYRRQTTDTTAAYRHLPLLSCQNLRDAIPYDCVPVAVEMVVGARRLDEYAHPERAFYIFGAEDATLGERVLSWCRDVVFVPTARCMNLAACVNVVLYDRVSKRGDWPERRPGGER